MMSSSSRRKSSARPSATRLKPEGISARIRNRAVSIARGKYNLSVEDFALAYDAGLDKLAARRKTLLIAVLCSVVATLLIWVLAVTVPETVSWIYSYGVNSNLPVGAGTLTTVALMSIPFTPPFVLVFALANLLFPPSIGPQAPSGLMSSFQYGEQSKKHYLIFVVAGMFGGLNCILLWLGVETAMGK